MLGLTTGNVEEAAHVKLARPNLNRYFCLRRLRFRFTGPHGAHQEGARAGRLRLGAHPRQGPQLSCGDTPRDVDAGHGAGIRVVGVATGEYTAEELIEAGADAAIHSLVEGLPLL